MTLSEQHLYCMSMLAPDEFTRMERLMADLLPACSVQEEAVLLELHARLLSIHAAQSSLRISRNRLMELQLQTAR